MKKPNKTQVRTLFDKHKHRYTAMLDNAKLGHAGYRIGELLALIEVWDSVGVAQFDYDRCSIDAQNEIDEAIESGELE